MNTTVTFVNVLGTTTGSITVNGSISIGRGSNEGSTYITLDEDYATLDGTSTFTSLIISAPGSSLVFTTTIASEFNVTPTPTPSPTMTPYFVYSAGSEYTECRTCCPCESGSTVTQLNVPHPVWTDNQGRAVQQIDSVQLGGMNGLYS